jgi:hypothetical protein
MRSESNAGMVLLRISSCEGRADNDPSGVPRVPNELQNRFQLHLEKSGIVYPYGKQMNRIVTALGQAGFGRKDLVVSEYRGTQGLKNLGR